MSEKNVLEKAIDYYGEDFQIIKAMEELSELQVELAKYIGCKILAKKHNLMGIHDEIADAQIMLDQLNIIFDKEAINKRIAFKLNRLNEHITNG